MIEIIERLRYLISGNLDEVTADDLEVAGNEIERLQARLNEAIQCCSIKDSRLLRQEARLAEAEALLSRVRCYLVVPPQSVIDGIDAFLTPADSAPAVGAARYRLQDKRDPYRFVDYDAKLWNLIVVPSDQPADVVLRNGDTLQFTSLNTDDGLEITDVKVIRADKSGASK